LKKIKASLGVDRDLFEGGGQQSFAIVAKTHPMNDRIAAEAPNEDAETATAPCPSHYDFVSDELQTS
jgi:hypothetical protein